MSSVIYGCLTQNYIPFYHQTNSPISFIFIQKLLSNHHFITTFYSLAITVGMPKLDVWNQILQEVNLDQCFWFENSMFQNSILCLLYFDKIMRWASNKTLLTKHHWFKFEFQRHFVIAVIAETKLGNTTIDLLELLQRSHKQLEPNMLQLYWNRMSET